MRKEKTPMACIDPNQEWTIFTLVDGRPESERAKLVFCLSIKDDGRIEGEGTDVFGQNESLSPVTGTSQPLPALDQGFSTPPTQMTLNFTWRQSKAVLSGTTFRNGGANKFLGRFATFKSTGVNDGSAGIEPGAATEDVGTGTGTQT
jgi:hypothetical protein